MATPVVSQTAAIICQYFAEDYYPYAVKNAMVSNATCITLSPFVVSGLVYEKFLPLSYLFRIADGVPESFGCTNQGSVDERRQVSQRHGNGGDGVTNIQPYDKNQNFGWLALQCEGVLCIGIPHLK